MMPAAPLDSLPALDTEAATTDRAARSRVLDRIGLAVLRCEVAELAAEVCPPFRMARAAILEAGEGVLWQGLTASWTPARLAVQALNAAGGPGSFAPFAHTLEALAAMPDPFSADERADFTARGWLLDPDLPAVLPAVSAALDLAELARAGDLLAALREAASEPLRGLAPELVLLDALAVARRRRAGTRSARRVAFLGVVLARCEAIAAGPLPRQIRQRVALPALRNAHGGHAPRMDHAHHRRLKGVARLFLRRFAADPLISAAAQEARARDAEAATEAATARAQRRTEAEAARAARIEAREQDRARRAALRAEAAANRATLRAAREVVVSS